MNDPPAFKFNMANLKHKGKSILFNQLPKSIQRLVLQDNPTIDTTQLKCEKTDYKHLSNKEKAAYREASKNSSGKPFIAKI